MGAGIDSNRGTQALVLATISFTLSFAAWGLIGGLASVFTELYSLTASQTALLVAVPVLLGFARATPHGHADRSLRWADHVRAADGVLRGCGLDRAADLQLSESCLRRRSSSASPGRRSRSGRRLSPAGLPRTARARRSGFTVWEHWDSPSRSSADPLSRAGSAGRACSAARRSSSSCGPPCTRRSRAILRTPRSQRPWAPWSRFSGARPRRGCSGPSTS